MYIKLYISYFLINKYTKSHLDPVMFEVIEVILEVVYKLQKYNYSGTADNR